MQMAGMTYLSLVQEEEGVQRLPKFYVLEQVRPQLGLMGKQIPSQLLRFLGHKAGVLAF